MDSGIAGKSSAQFWWIGYVPAAALFCFVLWLLYYAGSAVLIPLISSFALALMLEPLVDWMQRRTRCTRNAAVLLSLLAAIVAVLLIVVLLLPGVVTQFRESLTKLPLAVAAVNRSLQNWLEYARQNLSPAVFASLQDFLNSFQSDPSVVTDNLGTYLSQGLFGLVNLSSATIGLLIVPFFVYYLLLDMQNIRLFVENRIPVRHRGAGKRLLDETGEVVRGYVRGRLLIAVILSVFYALGLWLLDVPLWAAIGLIAGIVGIIPYIGLIVGFVLAIGFALLDGGETWKLVGVVVVFVLAQPFEDYVLTPKIIGDRLDLHPMLVFIALLIAGSLFGVLGLVLAIPVLGVLKVFLRFFDELYLRSEFFARPPKTGENSNVQQAAAATASAADIAADADGFEKTRESVR